MPNVYVITGATSDVGIALLGRLLATANREDVFIAQGCGDLHKLAPLCQAHPGQVRPFDVDLSDRAKVDVLIDLVGQSGLVPTHIIHLPALPVVNVKFKNFDEDRFAKDMEIQLYSIVRLCKAFLPAMAKAKFGRVLFIQTSYTIGCPPKNTAAYVMAKSALGGLLKSLAVEYARFGITVNCVAPSMMETHFLQDTPSLIVQAAAAENPMGRNATPADVVPAMEFLLSAEAGFITGVTLPVTGGSAIV
ncbi:MAG: SDR family NAD(P)-dependent oxidoreductase [Gemmiger sp.]|nr:SDR family NAD(P)-dependent oxidoreductase [Gemmiger sp.]